MNFLKSLVIIFIISFLFPSFSLASDFGFIPLNEGNWWIYKVSSASLLDENGNYKENDDGSQELFKNTSLVKIEIIKVARCKEVTVALFNNIPGGLYDEKATLIVMNNKDYYWADEGVYDLIVKNKGKIKIDGYDILTIDNNIKLGKIKWQELSLPLTKNKLFYCDEMEKSRGDNYYCNWVRSIKPAKQEYFPGKNEYEIAQYTLSDESHSYYVAGVGMTYYSYLHHSSLDEKSWNLQKYYISTK